MTDWTQRPPPRTLGGRMRAAGRGAEEMLAEEMDAERRRDARATYLDRSEGLAQLRAAERALTRAALHFNEIEDGRRLSGEMTFLIGGLSQTVESLLGVLLKPSEADL